MVRRGEKNLGLAVHARGGYLMSLNSTKRKSKMVSFRLTAEDYRVLHEACESYRARSVSELARIALRNLARNSGEPIDGRIRQMQEQIRLLTCDIERLAEERRGGSMTEAAHV